MGETAVMGSGTVTSAVMGSGTFAGAGTGNVYGTYVHGIFDRKETASAILEALAKRKGLSGFEASLLNYREYKEREYDRMADVLRQYLDMEAIYGMLK